MFRETRNTAGGTPALPDARLFLRHPPRDELGDLGNLARGEGLGGPGGFGGIPIHQREIRVVLVLLMLLGAASVFLCGQSLDIALSVRTGRANTSPDHPKP